jgi:hypothetical protein
MSLPLTARAQAVTHASANATSHVSAPAKAARAYLASNPGSSESPFGKLVSQFAKGETPST